MIFALTAVSTINIDCKISHLTLRQPINTNIILIYLFEIPMEIGLYGYLWKMCSSGLFATF